MCSSECGFKVEKRWVGVKENGGVEATEQESVNLTMDSEILYGRASTTDPM